MIYAYDYAYPSYDSTGLGSEIINSFIPNEATKPSWAPWTAENSLFCKCPLRNHSKLIKVTWIGINDLIYGDGDTDRPLDLIFHYQEMLYEYGARRFLLFDIPTIERSPGGGIVYLINSLIKRQGKVWSLHHGMEWQTPNTC